MKKKTLRLLSYNIHKGYAPGGLKFTLEEIKKSIHALKPDLICLQEVQGKHVRHQKHFPDRLDFSQLEFLAEGLWPHSVYGKNAAYPKGHHGNAILSRYPIQFWENQDISLSSYERRGLLHAAIEIPNHKKPLHVICTHLGLFETDREIQARSIYERIEAMVPHNEPLLVAGDFNDWRQRITQVLLRQSNLEEAFQVTEGKHAKTFPAWLPVFRLDRVYFRGLDVKTASRLFGNPWNRISDHLGLLCEFAW